MSLAILRELIILGFKNLLCLSVYHLCINMP